MIQDSMIVIGSVPCDEPCTQVGAPDYIEKSINECENFINLIRKRIGKEPKGANLKVKEFQHELGNYFEVVCLIENDNNVALDYALKCESQAPTRWDE